MESEKIFGRESGESIESRIILYFRRHGKKQKALEGQDDADILLTAEGRAQAIAIGKELKPNLPVGLAKGSRRKRAQEMAGRIMLANESRIALDMTLDEIQAEIGKELKFGRKISEDKRLDFYELPGSKMEQLETQAYNEKRTTDFMVHESDDIARETKDTYSSSYTRLAGQVAELVKQYAKIGNNFNRLVASDPDKYSEFYNQMERYFGTHNTVSDSFVAKVLEKQGGVAAREEFLKVVGSYGFAESEGFGVEIVNREGAQEIIMRVEVKDKTWNILIKPELLDELIHDRDVFNKQIEESVQ